MKTKKAANEILEVKELISNSVESKEANLTEVELGLTSSIRIKMTFCETL
jgi:hypothetical protein